MHNDQILNIFKYLVMSFNSDGRLAIDSILHSVNEKLQNKYSSNVLSCYKKQFLSNTPHRDGVLVSNTLLFESGSINTLIS